MNVAVDSETALIDAGLLAPPLVCVSTCTGTLEPKLYRWDESFELLREIFTSADLIVGQNFSFDCAVFAAQFPALLPDIFKAYFEGRIVDTMLNERLIHIARGCLDGYRDHNGTFHKYGYGLADLCHRYGLETLDKDTWRLRYSEFRDVPLADWSEGARLYALTDAKVTLQVHYKQSEFSEFLVDGPAQARKAFALHLAACRGMITDARACEDFIEATRLDIERAKGVLIEHKLMRLDGTKDTKVAKARMVEACNELGIPVPTTKKPKDASDKWKPGVSLDAESTRNTGDSVLMDYSLYTSSDKAMTRALTIQKGSRGTPLQTRWTSLVDTGRISSAAPSFPLIGDNLTNLPRKPGLRECFVPRKGYVFCSLDLDMAEAIGVAQIHYWAFGRSKLGEALNWRGPKGEKKDIHCILGAEMMGCSYDEMLANKKVGQYKKERQNAKFGNYGLWGGMGAPKFMATTNATIEKRADKIDLDTSYRIKNSWKNAWAPESVDYFEWTSEMLGQGGVAYIKQFISGRVRGCLDYCQVANTFFQGLIADGIGAAMLPIAHEMYCVPSSPLFGSRMLLNLHDELFAELVEEKAHEAAFRMQNIMLTTFNTKFTPDVNISGEPALMRRWWKDAPSLYLHGQLVPAKPQVNGRDVILVGKEDQATWVADI